MWLQAKRFSLHLSQLYGLFFTSFPSAFWNTSRLNEYMNETLFKHKIEALSKHSAFKSVCIAVENFPSRLVTSLSSGYETLCSVFGIFMHVNVC